MALRPTSRAWVVAISASCGVHLALVIHETAPMAVFTGTSTNVEVEWLVMPTPEEESPAPEVQPEAPALEPAPAATRRRRRRARSSAVIATTTSTSLSPGPPSQTAEAEDPVVPAVTAEPQVDPGNLTPSAVAATAFGPRIDLLEEREDAMERALTADLYRVANAAPYDTVRPPPELEATGDGGFRYRGHLFEARIAPDGTVTFEDAPNFAHTGGVSFSFDISAAAEQAAGNDPHSAERRWFMEETRRTRDRLAGEARARIEGRGLVRLRRSLRETWSGNAPAVERRRRLFRLWDACEEDEVGAVARAAIIDFVRDRAPAGSEDAYTQSELASLNGRRISAERFTPYE